MNIPLLILQEQWSASTLSIVRYSGSIKIDGHVYAMIGVYDDLVRADLLRSFTTLGRDRFIELVNQGCTAEEIKHIAGLKRNARTLDGPSIFK